MYDCVVIGGGISGLSSAYENICAGHRVALIEPDTPGGVIQTIQKEGFILERGPNVLLAKPELVSLIDRLGLNDKVIEPSLARVKHYIWHNDGPAVLPKSPGTFLSTPLLSLGAKAGVIRGIFRRPPFSSADHDLSVSDFFSDLLHPEVAQNLLDPFLRGIFGGKIDELSTRALFPSLWEGITEHGSLFKYLKSKKGSKKNKPTSISFQGGISTLVNALVDAIGKNASIVAAAAQDVQSDGGKFRVVTSDGAELEAGKVVVATSGSVSAGYLHHLAPELVGYLSNLKYAPIVVMHVALPRECELPEDGFGVLFPGSAYSNMLGVMFNSQLFPMTAPAGEHLLTVCLGGSHRPELFELEDAALEKLVYAELLEKFNFKDLRTLSVSRWKQAIPQYALGHQQLEEKMREAELQHPGLEFRGADIGGVGVPDRVKISQMRIN